jgi:serine/threonine protein kinase
MVEKVRGGDKHSSFGSLASGGSQGSASGAQSGPSWFIDSNNRNIKEEYHFMEKIASGGFGVVYLAEHRKTSKICILSR